MVDVVPAAKPPTAVQVEPAAFRLDTQLGRVWRIKGETASPVNVESFGSDAADSEAETKGLQRRLDQIVLPEVDFRQANIADGVQFFESAANEFARAPAAPGRRDPISIAWPTRPSATVATDPFSPPDDRGAVPSTGRPITFQAYQISLWKTLNAAADLAGCEVVIRKRKVLVRPPGWEEGVPETRCYRVSPSQINPLGIGTVANEFARLGFVPAEGGGLNYLPELQIVALTDVPLKHDAFMGLLRSKGLVPAEPGRWRLVAQPINGRNQLFLLDSAGGRTWVYRATASADGSRQDDFVEMRPDVLSDFSPLAPKSVRDH